MDSPFSPPQLPQAPPPSPTSSPLLSYMFTPYPSRASTPPPMKVTGSSTTAHGREDLDDNELANLRLRLRSAENVRQIEALNRSITSTLEQYASSAVPASMTAGQILPPKRSNSELASTQTPERAGENKFPAYDEQLAMDLIHHPPPPHTMRVRTRQVQQAVDNEFYMVERGERPFPTGLFGRIMLRAGYLPTPMAATQAYSQLPVTMHKPDSR